VATSQVAPPPGFELDQPEQQSSPTPPPGFEIDQPQDNSGTVRNDVGNKVIVPKPGESFEDTMQRAAAYGKTVTPTQINAELATAPTKAAEALVAAPVIGAAGTAALAAPSEAVGAGEKVLQLTESQLEKFAEAYPHLAKLAGHFGFGAGVTGAYELFRKLTGGGK
jgi:hypothetical protein